MRTTWAVGIGMMAALLTASARGQMYWEEDFESYAIDSVLEGQTGPNGQTWEHWNLWPPSSGAVSAMPVRAIGFDGSHAGAGLPSSGGNWISLGATIDPNEPLIVEWDMISAGRTSALPQYWLRDNARSRNVSFTMDNWNTLQIQDQVGIITGLQANPPVNSDAPISSELLRAPPRGLHIKEEFDLLNKTYTASYYDIDDPGRVITKQWTYTEDYLPSSIHLFAYSSSGYDNILIGVPEPASMMLLGVGGLLLRWRRPSA